MALSLSRGFRSLIAGRAVRNGLSPFTQVASRGLPRGGVPAAAAHGIRGFCVPSSPETQTPVAPKTPVEEEFASELKKVAGSADDVLTCSEGRELLHLRRGGFAYKMREVTITRKSIPTSMKKLNKLCRLIRQESVEEALYQLRYARQAKAADIMQQIGAGLRHAEEKLGIGADQLKIAKAIPNRGSYLKRLDIKGRGRSGMIKRPSTHLTIVLREIDPDNQDPWVVAGKRKPGFRRILKKYKQANKGKLVPVQATKGSAKVPNSTPEPVQPALTSA